MFPLDCRRGAVLMQGKDRSHLLVLFNVEMQNSGRYACKILYGPPVGPHFQDTVELPSYDYLIAPLFTPRRRESITINPILHPYATIPSVSRSYADDITPSQRQVQTLANTVEKALEEEDVKHSKFHKGLHAQQTFANAVNQNPSWSLMHNHYGPSNSRYSFTQCSENLSASAHIASTAMTFGATFGATIGVSIDNMRSSPLWLTIGFQDRSDGQELLYELEGSTAFAPAASHVPFVPERTDRKSSRQGKLRRFL